MKNFISFENSREDSRNALERFAGSTNLDFIFDDDDEPSDDITREMEEIVIENTRKKSSSESTTVTQSVQSFGKKEKFHKYYNDDDESDNIIVTTGDVESDVVEAMESLIHSETGNITPNEYSSYTVMGGEPMGNYLDAQHDENATVDDICGDCKNDSNEVALPSVKVSIDQNTAPFSRMVLTDGFVDMSMNYTTMIGKDIRYITEALKNCDADTIISYIADMKLGILTTRIPSAVLSRKEFETEVYLINKINNKKFVFIYDRDFDNILIYKIDDSFNNICTQYNDGAMALNILLQMYELAVAEETCFSPLYNDMDELKPNTTFNSIVMNDIMYDKDTEYASSVTTSIDIDSVFNIIDFSEITSSVTNVIDLIDVNTDEEDVNEDDEEEDIGDFIDSIDRTLRDINDEDDDDDDDMDIEDMDPDSKDITNVLNESIKRSSLDNMTIPVRRKNS